MAEQPKETIVSATMVAVSSERTALGEAVSAAMIQAINDCHAEGQTAPERIRERMQEARQKVLDEYDRQQSTQVTPKT